MDAAREVLTDGPGWLLIGLGFEALPGAVAGVEPEGTSDARDSKAARLSVS